MERIEEIVAEYVGKGIHVSQETVEYLIWYCNRKMDVAGIKDREEYLPLLFEDEMRYYFLREAVNATTMLRNLEKEGMLCEKCAE